MNTAENVYVVKVTDKAVLLRFTCGEEFWIPKSNIVECVDDESEQEIDTADLEEGNTIDVEIAEWFIIGTEGLEDAMEDE